MDLGNILSGLSGSCWTDSVFNLVDDLDSFQVNCIQKISVCIWFGAEQVCRLSAKCFSLHPNRVQRLCGDISASQPAHGDRLCIYASLLEEHEFHTEAVHSGVADQGTASVTLNYGTEKKWSSKKVCLHGCYIISMSSIGPGG